jgi:hypothetical protein
VESSVILSVEKLTFHWDALRQEAELHVLPHVRLGAPADAFSMNGERPGAAETTDAAMDRAGHGDG